MVPKYKLFILAFVLTLGLDQATKIWARQSLKPRAPEHYASDPTAALLRRCAAGTYDPYDDQVRAERERADFGTPSRVSRRTPSGNDPGGSGGAVPH